MRSLVLSSVLVLAACTVDEGDSCEPYDARCEGASQALLCVGGTARRVQCRGADGCVSRFDAVHCDRSVAREGDACIGGVACTSDRAGFLVCRGGHFVRGANCPNGCIAEGDRAECPGPEVLPPLE